MAKKKRSKSKPSTRNTVVIPPWLYAVLKREAIRCNRPITKQLKHILEQALVDSGALTREEIERQSTGEE